MLHLLKASLHPFGRCDRGGMLRLTCALIALQVLMGIVVWGLGFRFDGIAAQVLKFGFLWLGFCALAKRLHDIGYSAWWIPGFVFMLLGWCFAQTFVLFSLAGPAMLDVSGPMFWVSIAGMLSPVIAVTVWIHYARGVPAHNRHGPPPGKHGVSKPVARETAAVAVAGGA